MNRGKSCVARSDPGDSRLTYALPLAIPWGVKTLLLRATLAILCMGCAHASLRIQGTALWSITKPDCTIEVVGAVQNLGPAGSISGSLKLALWATSGPFPSPGVIVAEAELGQLRGGAQIQDFRHRVPVDVTGQTGTHHFSLVLMEFTRAGWFNRVVVPGGTRNLENGDFLDDAKWRARGNRFLMPPTGVTEGQRLRLQTKANSSFTRITPGTEADLFVTFGEVNQAKLRRGSITGNAEFSYKRGRDSLRGRRHRTGRVSIFSNGLREAEVALFFRSTTKGIYRMAGGGRVTWGNFVLR